MGAGEDGGFVFAAEDSDFSGDAAEHVGVAAVVHVLTTGPAHGVDAVGFDEQALARRAHRNGGDVFIEGREGPDAHITAKGKVVIEMVVGSVPVHVVGVGIAANDLVDFPFHALSVQHDGLVMRGGKGHLALEHFALQGEVGVAPDVVHADFADEGGFFQPGQYGFPRGFGGVPGMDAVGAEDVCVLAGEGLGVCAFLWRGAADDAGHSMVREKIFSEGREVDVGVAQCQHAAPSSRSRWWMRVRRSPWA